ncbi:sarcosine oxidase subunit alpha family protein [Poseidonocella sedimentorum]|uniref:Sarcosine oxidase subunit alpha n=1 Tax=Poseidonocella sedimentorum TaxID=871652 RepID=A0A1I6CSM8_9RHOB|nr:sarcosine oxidase subunit alpha family protein [Poseidonocella sedimentorum]SFQ96169.1 sarcosine oxidase subunit alpha [Poseidonocella sedimentorum]
MSVRLKTGGRLIDRSQPRSFRFNGRVLRGYKGDTLASALLASGQTLLGRSFKYHRPRGLVGSGVEEPNGLVALGTGDQLEPNQRTTTTELREGMELRSQNHWPSLGFDIGALNSLAPRLFPAGFYYKTFTWPRSFWKHVYEPIIRRSAGLGPAPDAEARDPDSYEHFHAFVDVLVIGGGLAGLEAARVAGASGARVLLIEQTAHWGGRAAKDEQIVNGSPVDNLVEEIRAELSAMGNVQCRSRTMGVGVYDHGLVLAVENLAENASINDAARQRLWKIRAGQVIVATGALERPLSFAGNDVPGVMLASAIRDYLIDFGVSPGDRTVVVTNNDSAYRTAIALKTHGLDVPAILDARAGGGGALAQEARALGIRVEAGRGIARVLGGRAVRGVAICAQAGEGVVQEEIACDAVAMSGGWSPVVHLWSHCGGKLRWDDAAAAFGPDVDKAPLGADGAPFVSAAGTANGVWGLGAVLADSARVGAEVAARLRREGAAPRSVEIDAPEEAPMEPVWLMPQGAGPKLRAKAFLDFQNDVKVSDVQLAAQEGFASVEHAKRYTTLGMATDQGKLSNINGLAILSDALGQPIPQTGTTTFRPPYAPLTLGVIAGEAHGSLFQPVRETPMQAWHEARGAYCEPVGQWRRPYCYPVGEESHEDAVRREVRAVREGVGMLDASTLGKILVQGPDAGRFLDMLYTGRISTLAIGKCRYGLMCSENGFLMDDGVVARLGPESFLVHTTTGGADHIHAHMEDWLQTEWWDWQVYTANLTEQYAQIVVAGPKARDVLEALGGMDVSEARLPFMTWAEGALGGFDARVFRISFSGELSFEIAVPAGQGQALWDAILKAGADHAITPYGTEALHVLRAERGFIMIGDETDGTVIPQDLGLDWAIARKKDDYIGKRAQARAHMVDPERWTLVGLQTIDGTVLPDGAYAVDAGENENGQRNVQGRVTSSYFSPTLGRGIALGLVRRGPERMGEVLEFPRIGGASAMARIVSPVFYDPEAEATDG